MSGVAVAAALLGALVTSSAVAVVYTQHLSREAYAEISANRVALDRIDEDWSRLQIEQSTFSGHERVERTARESLDMRLPGPEGTTMIVR
mgnify:CR=1 FL=1